MTINPADFPNMREGNYRKTSDPLAEENCIAHACGARGEWWEPALGRSWPLGPPYYNKKIESLLYLFERRRFVVCDSPEHEPECEKIAIYGSGGAYTHVARQLSEDGTWTSKLGPEDDINHATLDVLVGPEYGDVVKIMKRRRSGDEIPRCCECEERHAQQQDQTPP